jgi:hypothetical protein
MKPTEYALAALLTGIVIGLALFYGLRQFLALGRLRLQVDIADEERLYVRRQTWIRLLGCLMLLALGCLLAGAYVSGLEQRAHELGEQIDGQKAAGQPPVLTPEQQAFRELYRWYWLGVLALVLGVLVLAGLDLLTIRRFRLGQMKQISADRKEMLQEELAKIRHTRNGHATPGGDEAKP